ncbi:hypothetical protein [Deinococcus petrolearius]|uniref:Uncharacterized protein n=1 Tax=Deinococcus petrolearius TaxID=1751295 RepID=A0ABW1DP21_9DEIO
MTDSTKPKWLYLSEYVETIHPKRRAGLPGKIREGVQLGLIVAFPTADRLTVTYTKPDNGSGEREMYDYAFKDTPEARDWLAGLARSKSGPHYRTKEQLDSGRFDFEAEARKYAQQVKRKKPGAGTRTRRQQAEAPADAGGQDPEAPSA